MDTTVAPMTGLEWDHLVEVGILDGPFELVGGRKMRLMTENPPHASTISRLDAVLRRALVDDRLLRLGNPLALGPVDRPEPDLAVVLAREDHYATRHPEPTETDLVVEVSMSSLQTNLGEKAMRYAYAGIPSYWVVDVAARVVVVHVDPDVERGVWASVTRVPYGEPLQADCLTEPVTLQP